jgi:hypothetical protein
MTVCNSTLRVNLERRGNPNPSLCACVFVRELDGETIASLLAAATEHCASPLGFHARAKPMGFDAALVPGTIRGLTHGRLQMTVRTTLRCRPVKLFEACGWGKRLVRGPSRSSHGVSVSRRIGLACIGTRMLRKLTNEALIRSEGRNQPRAPGHESDKHFGVATRRTRRATLSESAPRCPSNFRARPPPRFSPSPFGAPESSRVESSTSDDGHGPPTRLDFSTRAA